MIHIDIRSDLKQVAARFQRATQAELRPAIARALNRTAETTRSEAGKEIRQKYNLKIASVNRQIRITKATRQKLEALVRVSGKRIPLSQFSVSQTKRGVTVAVKKQAGRKLIPHAFIATMRSGHRGVFLRSRSPRVYPPSYRSGRLSKRGADLPITELYSLSLPQAFGAKLIVKALEKTIRRRFPIEFERELRFALSKRNG